MADDLWTAALKDRNREGNPESDVREQADLDRLRFIEQDLNSGDTLVIMTFPAPVHGSLHLTCTWDKWTDKRFRMDSSKLRATGSKVLERALGPAMQRRFRNRHKHITNPLPNGVEYIVDFTPIAEGDEYASEVALLQLPTEVKDYWVAKERLGVSKYLVSGHDDNCPRHLVIPNYCQKLDNPPVVVTGPAHSPPGQAIRVDLADILPTPVRDIPEYCPVRHRATILRILRLIHGDDMVLNSAARVYTVAGVAKTLDLANIVRDPLLSWLTAAPNDSFVDLNPEVALNIAWNAQIPGVTRAAFRIIVAEQALDELGEKNSRYQRQPKTKFGRRRANIADDDLDNAIQHATRKLTGRVERTSQFLQGDNPCDFLGMPSWDAFAKLQYVLSQPPTVRPDVEATFAAHSIRDHVDEIKSCVNLYLKKAISAANSCGQTSSNAVEITNNNLMGYVPRPDFRVFFLIYEEDLSNKQRLLVSHFWTTVLQSLHEKDGLADMATPSGSTLREVMLHLAMVLASVIKRELIPELIGQFPENLFVTPEKLQAQLIDSVHDLFSSFRVSEIEREMPLMRTEHLCLGLNDAEMAFLPLWAGGLEDGSGATLQEGDIPDSEMGPVQPGPNFVTGQTIAPSTTVDFDDMSIIHGPSTAAVQQTTERDHPHTETIATQTVDESFAMVTDQSQSVASEIGDVDMDPKSDGGSDGSSKYDDFDIVDPDDDDDDDDDDNWSLAY